MLADTPRAPRRLPNGDGNGVQGSGGGDRLKFVVLGQKQRTERRRSGIDDVEHLHADVVELGAEVVHGPVDQGYGQREFRVRDPEGYILAFGQPLDG